MTVTQPLHRHSDWARRYTAALNEVVGRGIDPEQHQLIVGYGLRTRQYIAYLAVTKLILRFINKAEGREPVGCRTFCDIISNQTAEEATAGDAWSSEQDGCVNASIPGPPEFFGIDYLRPDKSEMAAYLHLIELALDLPGQTREYVLENFDTLLESWKKTNISAASLLLARRDGADFDTDKPCVNRALFGLIMRQSAEAVLEFIEEHVPEMRVEIRYQTEAHSPGLDNPEKPTLLIRDVNGGAPDRQLQGDVILDFSGTHLHSPAPRAVLPHVYSSLSNARRIGEYLRMRDCLNPDGTLIDGKKIGVFGQQLSSVDFQVSTRLFKRTPRHNSLVCCRSSPPRF